MALKDTAVCRGVIVPDSNGGVSGATRNDTTRWVDGNVIDWALMSNEFIGTSICLQGGSKNHSVIGA